MSNKVSIAIVTLISATVLEAWATNTAAPPSSAPPAKVRTVPEDSLKWRRDPFIGTGAQKGNVQRTAVPAAKKTANMSSDSNDINLQGIMQADKAFHALINGRVFKKGDKLGRLTIIEISRYCVVVQNELKEKTTHDIHKGKITRGEK